ncbi:MAG: hypothetical protein KDA96_23760, partial [Planctomycetaceae bacterium]|nr:hypothetical protein [Planctomycetaceae bacterium]
HDQMTHNLCDAPVGAQTRSNVLPGVTARVTAPGWIVLGLLARSEQMSESSFAGASGFEIECQKTREFESHLR